MFPPEITDHVLSFLQWDRATLKVCSQVHPSLSKLVERHLYAHLTVQNFRFSANPDAYLPFELLKHILDNPNIAKHVRSLRIDLFIRHYHRTNNYQELEHILPALTQLEAVFLSSSLDAPFDWYDLLVSFRTAFTNCFRLPTLTDVKVSNINGFPLSALDHSSSLKRLLLSGDFSYLPSAHSPVHSLLDSLILRSCSSMDIVTFWASSRSLRSLDFNGDFRLLSPLLEACADTLTTLKIHVPHDFRTRYYLTSNTSTHFTPIPFSLACLPHLRRLVIHSSISFSQQFWINSTSDESHELRLSYSCLPSIMHLVDSLPSPPTNLLFLLISIAITLDDSLHGISEANWSPLLSFPYFDVIPSVELRVCAQRRGRQIPSVELLDTLKQDPQLVQLERHHSFLINAVQKPLAGQLADAYV